MSYQLRNSIVLGVLLVLILLGGGYYHWIRQPGQIGATEAKIKELDTELQNTPDLVGQFNTTRANVEDMKARWQNRTKNIPTADQTAETYDDLNGIINLAGFLKLDMIYQGEQLFGDYGYKVYNLRGESDFENLYRFIWLLENRRKLYKIPTLKLRTIEIVKTETKPGEEPSPEGREFRVGFEMIIHAYFTPAADLTGSVGYGEAMPAAFYYNPFKPLILSSIPPNILGLVEVERSELKAVIPGKAFIQDQNNQIQTLQEGDEVYLGYVTKIIPEEGKVEFTLNKGGIIERFVLTIRFETGVETK
ncbi:MAG: hypothetical protein ACE5H0_09650 [Bacteroidota bacterium]